MKRLVLLLLALGCPLISAQAEDEPVDFRKLIAPIFAEHCVRCHSPENNKGDVSLATFDDLKSNDFVSECENHGKPLNSEPKFRSISPLD